MNKKIVFGLTLLVSIVALVSGCSNGFTPTEIKKGSVWEAKQTILPGNNFLTKLPTTLPVPGGEARITVFICFHSNGKAYEKYVGDKPIHNGKHELIMGGESYDIDTADKKIIIGGKMFSSYTLESGELTIRRDGQIIGVYKLSSEPEFSN